MNDNLNKWTTGFFFTYLKETLGILNLKKTFTYASLLLGIFIDWAITYIIYETIIYFSN